MKNYLRTQITLYEEDKKEEASMHRSLLHGSWDQILQRRLSVDKVCGTFWKIYRLNSFHTWHLPYGVSLLTPYHFRVPSLIFGPLVAKYLVENRVFRTFWKNYWFHSLHKLLQYLKYHDTLVGKMMPKFFLNKVFLKNSHLCSTQLQNRNLYRIFLDEVGSDQIGGILSPFMGTACLS